MARELLFTVRAADCEWTYSPAGKNGGQNANKNHTAARVVHSPSGAVGESREHKSQLQNRQAAWRRMATSDAFRAWVRRTAAELAGTESIDRRVERAMAPENLRVDVMDNGHWRPLGEDEPLS